MKKPRIPREDQASLGTEWTLLVVGHDAED